MPFMRILLGSMLWLLVALAASAQSDTTHSRNKRIEGTVISKENGEPIGFAVASLFRSSDSTIVTGVVTDYNGFFKLVYSVNTEVFLRISCVGCQTKNISLSNFKSNLIDLDKIEIGTLTNLKEVQIMDDRPAYRVEEEKKIYRVDKDPVSASGAASDVLQNIPSVFIDLDGNVRLRGGGVRILINGKPTSVLGISRREVLDFLPANMIESVEIINNPSSRYDANGEAGIINIVLKKPKESGLYAAFLGTAGNNENLTGSGQINFRNKKWSVSVSDNIRKYHMTGTTNKNREINQFADPSYLDQRQEWGEYSLTNAMRTRVGFSPDSTNDFTATYLYRTTTGIGSGVTWYDRFNNLRELTKVYDRSSPDTSNDFSYDLSLGYTHRFKKKDQELTADFVNNRGVENSYTWNIQQYYDPSTLQPFTAPPLTESINDLAVQSRTMAQMDYTHPFGKRVKLEAGVKTSIRFSDLDYDFRKFDFNVYDYFSIPGLANHYKQWERINAAYATFRKPVKGISVKLGLRAEQTINKSELVTTQLFNKRSYIDLFPSLHLLKKIQNGHSFTFSYSRRINRPSIRSLNPFYRYIDAVTIRTGNPNLLPEYTHSLELSHTKNWKNTTFNSSIYFRHTSNTIQRISYIDSIGNAITTYGNFNFDRDIGIETYITSQIGKVYRMNVGLNAYKTIIDGKNLGEFFYSENYNLNAKLNNYFNLKYGWVIQLTGNYVSPIVTPVTRTQSIYFSDLSIRKEILGKRLTCSVRVSDLFYTRRQNSELINPVYHIYTYTRRASRMMFVSITYRPGIYKIKSKQKEEEPEEDNDNMGKDER